VDALAKARLVLQFRLGQLAQALQARTLVRLGEHDVEAQQRDLLAVEQLVDHFSHAVTAPWPAADFGQALFVQVDDDDALVQRLGHGRPQPRVIDDVVQPLQHADGQHAHDVHQGEQQGNQRDGNARPVLGKQLHLSPGPSAARCAAAFRPARTASACRQVRADHRSSA
jgi:hypothetical protein